MMINPLTQKRQKTKNVNPIINVAITKIVILIEETIGDFFFVSLETVIVKLIQITPLTQS
jgi:hypothetical protein